ncbi:MAG: hypothetical protein CV087_05615 [Candidatus Brocadia sp. WS118]|nr:MAG: hypothetical protein CV087_05615 [Candidatus Brocadia sp. WS118]
MCYYQALFEKFMQSTTGHFVLDGVSTNQNVSRRSPMINSNPVEQYLKWKESYRKSAHKSYRIWVERFQNFVSKFPEELKLEDIVEFSRTIDQRYAPRNVQYGMTIVRNYLRFFHEQGRLSIPLYFIRVPKASANSHHAITEEEYQRILVELNQRVPMPLQNLCIVRLLHDTGMRVGELCSLDITDIRGQMSAVIKTEKTTKRRRVFWGEETDAFLRLFLSLRSELETCSDTKALFVGSRGNCMGRLTSRSIQRMVKSVVQRAGIEEKISPHSFRHGFIHRLAKKGVPDAVIALMVGHSTTNTISDYTKLSRTEMEETYRRVF